MNVNLLTSNLRGQVFYDADCGLCSRGVTRWGGLFERRGFHWLPLQTPGVAARLGASDADLRAEMKLQLASGRVLGGVDAWKVLFRAGPVAQSQFGVSYARCTGRELRGQSENRPPEAPGNASDARKIVPVRRKLNDGVLAELRIFGERN